MPLKIFHTFGRAICLANTEPQAPCFKVTDTIEVIGGTKPKTFEEFLRGDESVRRLNLPLRRSPIYHDLAILRFPSVAIHHKAGIE